MRLADTLRWVISQRLAPRIGGGRHAAARDHGLQPPHPRSIVLGESEGKSFYEIIEASYTFGWRTFDQSCLEAYEQDIITEETALLYCSKRGVVTRGIDQHQEEARGNHQQPQPAPAERRCALGLAGPRRRPHRRPPPVFQTEIGLCPWILNLSVPMINPPCWG